MDDQNSRRDLAAQLAEAQAAGDGESVKNLKQAQTLLESNIKTRRAAEEENIKKLEEASDVAAKSGNKSLQEFYNYSLALTSAGNTLADAITAATDAANNSLKEETASFQATIAAIQASVADFGAGIDDSIRELRRGTLSDADAEADKLNEINEKLAKAKELARAGNTEGAKALRDEIVSLGKSIAKSGDQESTDKAIAVLEQAKALNEDIGSAEEKAAEALHATKVAYIESEKKASIAAAQDSYDAQIAAANAAHEAIMAQIAAENAARAAGYSGVFSIGRGAFQLQTGGGGSYSGPTGPGQTSNPADVQREGKTGNPLPSTGFAFGGPVFSGHLPGYGGGDRRHIIAEDGEFVQRKEAVRHYGIPMMDAINKMRLPKFALGGPIGLPVQKMARGGTVSAPEMIIELRGPGSTASAGRFPRRSATDELLSELGKSNAVRAGR